MKDKPFFPEIDDLDSIRKISLSNLSNSNKNNVIGDIIRLGLMNNKLEIVFSEENGITFLELHRKK